MPLSPMEAFALAMAACGEAAAEQVLAHVQQQYGIKIERKFFPIFLASWLEGERRNRSRLSAPVNPMPEDPTQAA